MLKKAEIRANRRDGYVIPKEFRLACDELASLRDALEQILVDNPDILPDRLINTHLDGGKPYGIRGQRAFYDLARDPRILDLAEAVMGPNLVLLFTHMFCKPANSARDVPWHQDGPFWPVAPLESVSVWVALDDVDAENGAMRVIPGSHREYQPHHLVDRPGSTLNREIDPEGIDDCDAVTISLKAGQVSLHDIGIVHSSAANSSGRRRAGLALRYMPATSQVYRKMPNSAADWADMPIELVRGKNCHDGTDFSLGVFGRPWPAE